MSRIGKKPIAIPEKVDVKINGAEIFVKGPKGELRRSFKQAIKMEAKDNSIILSPVKANPNKDILALWGTHASHIKNMVEGVLNGFTKNLIIEGIGYKAQVEAASAGGQGGANLVLNLGFSHPLKMPIPKGIEIKVEKNKIQISGADKEMVGETAAKIRSLKKPEPYKGKGIRYENEVIRRKSGKKAATSAA